MERQPDPYWFVFSSDVKDWYTDKDKRRWRRIWKDKQDRKALREGKFAKI